MYYVKLYYYMFFLVIVLKFFKVLLKELFLKKNMIIFYWYEVIDRYCSNCYLINGMKFCLNKILNFDLYSFEIVLKIC